MPSLFEGTAIHFFYIAAVPPAIYFLNRERGIAAKILSFTPLLFIGDISYSLYFIHTLVFPLSTVDPATHLAMHWPMVAGRCIAFLTTALVLSALAYRTLEKPARAVVMRLLA